MWKPLLLPDGFLVSDENPILSGDLELGGNVEVCDPGSGECSVTQSSGSIDSKEGLTANSISSSGLIIDVTISENINEGDLVSLTDTGWKKATVTPTINPAHAIALETKSSGETLEILLYGGFKNTSLTLNSAHTTLYLDNSGFVGVPTAFKQVVGNKLETSNSLFFSPDYTLISISGGS